VPPGDAGIETYVLAGGVVVGIADGTPDTAPDVYDVLLTATPNPPRPWVTAASIADLECPVHAAPAAATALVQVLRATESLPVAAALNVESMAYSMLQHGDAFRRWLRANAPRPSRASGADPVRLEREDARLDIVLHRPEVHNALDAAMRDALCDAFDLVAADPSIREVHLRGDGPSLCSGGDLTEFGIATDAAAAHLLRVERGVGRRLHDNASKVTAHLHGSCVGAGIEIAAFAHRVVATPDTTIRLPEVGMGLIPGAGGTASIPRRIGRHRTAYLALTDVSIDAGTAAAWGLVDELAPAR
jgi:enoyl-CoA hydratase/carnithine racemase